MAPPSEKDFSVATQTSGFSRAASVNKKDSGEKQRTGNTVADLDLPTYDDDTERQASQAANLSGVHDNTHRKLKARHIQLIGLVVFLLLRLRTEALPSHG